MPKYLNSSKGSKIETGTEGWQEYVKTEIYIIRDADVFSIKRLDHAQDAIDSYAAHLFSGADGDFDFSQYMVDF